MQANSPPIATWRRAAIPAMTWAVSLTAVLSLVIVISEWKRRFASAPIWLGGAGLLFLLLPFAAGRIHRSDRVMWLAIPACVAGWLITAFVYMAVYIRLGGGP